MANIVLLLFCLTGSVLCTMDDTLLVTNVIFRNGDRAPLSPLPIDKYDESFWPYGWGELTDMGRRQQDTLGRFLRHRYAHLLGNTFNHKKMEVRSSDIDRCLISAYKNLAGLYTNSAGDIPVHSVPVELDELLAMSRPCYLLTLERKRLLNSPVVRKLNVDYADFFQMLQDQTGVDLYENGLRDMWRISDTLLCESIHFGKLPAWASASNVSCNNNGAIPCKDKTVWEILKKMTDFQFYLMYSTNLIHKYNGGPLLVDIVGKFEEYVAGDRTVTFNMYSAHATTVAAVLAALGVFPLGHPQYTATIMIELHKAEDAANDYEVKVFYRPMADSAKVTELNILGCISTCKLSVVRAVVNGYKISDWNNECKNRAFNRTSTTQAVTSAKPRLKKEKDV